MLHRAQILLPQDERQVDSVRGEVRVQVRRGGVNRKRLLRDQGGAALIGEQDVGQGVGPVALRGKDIRPVKSQRQAGLLGLKKLARFRKAQFAAKTPLQFWLRLWGGRQGKRTPLKKALG